MREPIASSSPWPFNAAYFIGRAAGMSSPISSTPLAGPRRQVANELTGLRVDPSTAGAVACHKEEARVSAPTPAASRPTRRFCYGHRLRK